MPHPRESRKEKSFWRLDDVMVASKVSFVSDIEGNWEYLVKFVELSDALENVGENADGSLELKLKEGW